MLYGILLAILFLLLFYVKTNIATIKGSYGERQVNKILSNLDEETYKIYHDLYLPTENDKTTQVDHIVTSPYGIFVIETKHLDGWIFGSEKNKYWTQVIYKRKEKLFNPIWQNAGHIKALENYLVLDKKLFSSIIAFSTQSTFKFKEEFNRANVIQFPELHKTIKEHTLQVISENDLQTINRQLDKLVIVDKKDKKRVSADHINRIKLDRQKEKIPYFDKSKCPKCHSDLVKRSGKYGSFMGCSNYPKCRYTKKLAN